MRACVCVCTPLIMTLWQHSTKPKTKDELNTLLLGKNNVF